MQYGGAMGNREKKENKKTTSLSTDDGPSNPNYNF